MPSRPTMARQLALMQAIFALLTGCSPSTHQRTLYADAASRHPARAAFLSPGLTDTHATASRHPGSTGSDRLLVDQHGLLPGAPGPCRSVSPRTAQGRAKAHARGCGTAALLALVRGGAPARLRSLAHGRLPPLGGGAAGHSRFARRASQAPAAIPPAACSAARWIPRTRHHRPRRPAGGRGSVHRRGPARRGLRGGPLLHAARPLPLPGGHPPGDPPRCAAGRSVCA